MSENFRLKSKKQTVQILGVVLKNNCKEDSRLSMRTFPFPKKNLGPTQR